MKTLRFKARIAMCCLVISAICISVQSVASAGEEKKTEGLDTEEAATLRKQTYKGIITTSHRQAEGLIPHRVLVVPKEVDEMYKRKPIAVLELLLDIVKGDRPEHALSAVAFATALTASPEEAALLTHKLVAKDSFDEEQGGMTQRARYVTWLRDEITKLKKK